MRAFITLVSIALLEGCASCMGGLPSDGNNNADGNDDPDQPDVTDGDDGGRDTAPIPPCAQPEEEPNNSVGDAQQLTLGDWSCGVIDTPGDVEYFRATASEDGWLRVWARAADIGSTADLQLSLSSEVLDEFGAARTVNAVSARIPGSTDGRLIVPAAEASRWDILIFDDVPSYSDTHEWELVANMTKEPVECDHWEAEDRGDNANNSFETAEALLSGERVCGYIHGSDDLDLFTLDLPEGKSVISARVTAWNAGSPLNSDLTLFGPAGNANAYESSGEYGSDMDPILEFTTDRGGDWTVRVDDQALSGWLSWYQLEVTVASDDATDSGAPDSGVGGTTGGATE